MRNTSLNGAVDHTYDGTRQKLSSDYAEILGEYQQLHRAMMQSLSDDSISYESFVSQVERMHDMVNELKRMKLELRRRRNGHD